MRNSIALTVLLCAAGTTASCTTTASEPAAKPQRDWSAIAADGAIPEGEQPFELALELSELLGARDPVLRDDRAYSLLANWIVRQKRFEPDQLRELTRRWTGNLEQGLGSAGDDSVLLRSFSALALALIAARDLDTPFMGTEEVDALLQSALDYSARERDLRDWDAQLGWIHAVAHTADLLKFLARNPKVDTDGLNRILAAVEQRLATPMERGFSMGEDERLARTVAAVLLRAEHDEQGYAAFLEQLRDARARAANAAPFTAANVVVGQNILHMLRTLHSGLASIDGLPPHTQRARDATARAIARP